MRAKRLLMVCTVALAAIAAGAVAAGVPSTGPTAPASDTAAPAPPVPTHDLTEQDLRTYFDGLIPYALHRADMPGAVVTVVKDGHVLFAQGYGYADVKTKKPMVVDQSLVRPGSVSKLFTWTSVMQLVGEHKLDLDRNINDYLDFKFPEKFGKPITLRDIMTHSAGFEEVITDLTINDPKKLYPIDQYIKKHIPEELFPPGKVVAYSNYATTVAGYIVQRVSGEAVRPIRRRSYLRAAEDESLDVRAAAARALQAGHGHRLWRFERQSGAVRERRSSTRRRALHDRDRHGALHDGPSQSRFV